MTLVRSSLLNSIAVGIKLLTALVLNKVLAVAVGPAGFGILGQFNSVVGTVMGLATGGINNGVVKYTAERLDARDAQLRVWGTATRIVLIASAVIGIVLAALAPWLARRVLEDTTLRPAFYWLAVSLVFFAGNTIVLAILNGLKELRRYVIANVLGSLISLLVTMYMAVEFGLLGALISISITQPISFFCTLLVCRRTGWFRPGALLQTFDNADARRLGAFSLMALTSTACVPLTQVLVRHHLATTFGWEATGAWQGVWRISDMYLMLITSTLSVYYLPRLAEIRDNAEMRREILGAYRVVLPFTMFAALACYLLRDFIIVTLFTSRFAQMRELFAWQLVGDVMRIATWLVGFVFQARALMKRFIVSELLYAAVFYLSVRALTPRLGVEGATVAYAVSYGFYWLWVMLMLRDVLFERQVAPRV